MRARVAQAAAVAALAAAPGATAHGPCACTFPEFASPGAGVRTASAYRVVWNPAPRDFRGQTTPVELASGYRSDAPTVRVVDRPRSRPLRRARFEIPRGTPPGIYLVLIFDGSEGGGHTSWDYVQVVGRPRPQRAIAAARPVVDDGDRVGVAWAVPLAAAGLLAVLAAVLLVRPRRERRDRR